MRYAQKVRKNMKGKKYRRSLMVILTAFEVVFWILTGVCIERAEAGAADGPVIISQPNGFQCTVNATIQFKISASGTGPLKYQWQSRKDASSEWANSGKEGAKTPTLTVRATSGMHGWLFRCVVTDANGQKAYSRECKITVVNSISYPMHRFAKVGSTTTITVSASGTGPFKYQWQSRKDSTAEWKNSALEGAKTGTLTIHVTAGLHLWQFRCIATDRYGEKMYTAPISLTTHLALTSPVHDRHNKVGEKALFFAEASGEGVLKYQWESRKDENSSWSKSAQDGADRYNLEVPVTQGLNGWQFRCTISDSTGASIITNVATLWVVPTVKLKSDIVRVNAGSVAEFSVEATGKGPLRYQWQSRKDSTSEWTNSAQSGAKTPTLSVKTTTGLNGWQFRCVVTDGNGQKTESYIAKVVVYK